MNDAFPGRIRSLADLVLNGGRSSMVELQIVVLAVAGSSPVGRPLFLPLKRVSVQKVWADCGQLQRLFELSRGQTPLAA